MGPGVRRTRSGDLRVLIALAVNDWIEDRRNARLKHQHHEFLMLDLDSEQRRLADHMEFDDKQTQHGVRAMQALRSEHRNQDDKTAAAGALPSRRSNGIQRGSECRL